MADKLQKLELTWIGKGEEPKLEPRILIENPDYSFGDRNTGNMLIHGDNLLALKALEQEYSGKIKCVCIDPPYNTGSAFEQYDDGIEHSLWLNLMSQRLKILRNLLTEDGSIWIAIDDNECFYLKVLCDEIFGRQNFVTNVIWEKADSPRMDAIFFSGRHDYILCYAKNKSKLELNRNGESEEPLSHYNKTDQDGRLYYLKPLRAMGGQGDSREARPTLYYPLIAPDGTEVYPKKQDGKDGAWRWSRDKVASEIERIEWVNGRNGWVPYYRIYADSQKVRPPETIWTHQEVGSNRTSKAEIKSIFKEAKAFDTPKPEGLIMKILSLSTTENDIVVDSFLGSGTTAAVAHKMGRTWIGVELGDHAMTLCYPRLKSVVDGEQGGVSKNLSWKGGGGFKFYTLAPSLLNQDKYGNWVIAKEYNPSMLAAAMAKQEGFRYAPDEYVYWKQGKSSEKDYIYTTTQFITVEMLDKIHDEMQSDESLLISCKAFQSDCENRYANITIKKIPHMLLGRCEFGKEDYSLNIVNLPKDEDESETQEVREPRETYKKAKGKKSIQPNLFD